MLIEIPEVDELEREFLYIFEDSEVHEAIIENFRQYIVNNEKWTRKGTDAARVRARNNLMNLFKLCRERRFEMMDEYKELRNGE